MPKPKVRFVGLDVHKDSIVIAVAEEGRDAARAIGAFPSDWNSLHKQLRKLAKGFTLKLCYEAGPTGFDLHRRLVEAGFDNQVVAPSLIPRKPGERIKTDRRDAAALSELLWVNRNRLLAGKPVRGLRQVDISSTTDQENRRLTTLRKNASRARTRLINQIKHILRRHNLQWEMPTKTFPTQLAIAWLKKLVLPEIDQLEMNHLLVDLELAGQRVQELEEMLAQRCGTSEAAMLLASMPGVGHYTDRKSVV